MAYSTNPDLNNFVQQAVSRIAALENYDRYLGAFLFGSAARGEFTDGSDLDAVVYITGDACSQLNHPIVNGIKLDISFQNDESLTLMMEEQARKLKRVPMIAESVILFDKTGKLNRYKQEALQLSPPPLNEKDSSYNYFLIHNENVKVQRHIEEDPDTALLVMHTSLLEMLKLYFQANQQWFVGNKRILQMLDGWDLPLARKVRCFVNVNNIHEKKIYWDDIVSHILEPYGEVESIDQKNCTCPVCQQDLGNFT